MKLTSKGMLKSLMLCAGMFSLSAVAATDYVKDSFESGSDQLSVRQWLPDGSEVPLWTSSAAEPQDASKIVAGSVSYQGAKPMDAARFNSPTDTRILILDTMGETLSRAAGSVAFSDTAKLFVDTMVKFVKSEEAPTLPNTFKAAVYADVNSNLVVVSASKTSTTALKVDPDTWYRLTIELKSVVDGQDTIPVFRVRLNGDVVVVAEGQDNWLVANDTTGNALVLQSVDFQGTGSVDQLVLTDVDPYAPTVIMLSLTGLENADVTSNPAPTDGKIPSGTEIKIAAKTGYVLSNVTFTNTVVAGFRFGQSLTFTPVGAAGDVIAISTVATNAPVTTFFDGKEVNAGKLATWLGTYANATTDSGDYNAYLMNVNPTDYPNSTFKIDSVTVSGNSATITVSFGLAAIENINGSLVIQKFKTLGGSPTEVTVTPSATVKVDMTDYSFIKAVIK